MAVFSLREAKGNIGDTTYYWYAADDVDPVNYEDFVDEIVSECTVTRHDLKAVISALEEFIARALSNGFTVRFGDLGSFRTTVTSEGAESADALTADNITGVRVQFTAGTLLKNYLLVGGKAQTINFSVTSSL